MAQWCLDFDGVNDYVACGDVPTGGVANLTVEAWVRLDAAEAGGIVAKFVTTTAEEWKLEVNASRIVSFTVNYDGGKTTTVTAPAALTLGTWYHVAAVLDSDAGMCRLYVDGDEVDFEALVTGSSADNLVSNYMPDNYWPVNYWADMPAVSAVSVDNTAQAVEFGRLNGVYASLRLAWVRISNTVRYDAAFTAPRSPAFPDANTLAQWDFIEGTGTALNNRKATAAYDGAISGATWRWDAPERSDLWGAYERFGDAWTILIADVDRTAVVALDSIELVAQIGSNRDTAVFRMEDVAASVAAASWDHVQIWHGGSLEFGGFVVATDKMPTGINLDVVCHCVDWTTLLDKRVIAERATWTTATAKTILKDITELGYVTEFDATTHSEDGATGLDIENDYGYVGDLVKKLAEASGFYWFVREDEEGVVYLYFSDDAAAAPFGLSTSPDMATTFPLRVYQWSESGADLVNHFFLVVEGVPDTGATFTTGGTLANVVTILDRTVVEVLNSPSITAYGFLDATVSVDADEKELYTTAYLTSLGEPRISGRIEIRFPGGVRPGMTISVVHSVLDVNDSYLVHQVRTRPLGGGAIRYELTVSNRVREKQNSFSTWRQVQNRLEIANRRRTENWVKKA